jgi:hypothetical protein
MADDRDEVDLISAIKYRDIPIVPEGERHDA